MVSDVGALGFWLFVAALLVGGIWADSRKKAERHETLRRIVEKTGTIDEAKLRELFEEETDETKPGYAYRGLRIVGTIVMFVAAALATFIVIAATLAKLFGPVAMLADIHTALIMFLSVSAALGVAGLGLFFSARFATPPPNNEPPAR
jgi:hypothetical protein